MSVETLTQELVALRKEAEGSISSVDGLDSLEKLRIEFLGKKGRVTEVLKGLKDLSKEERPLIGAEANKLRDELQGLLTLRTREIKTAVIDLKIKKESVDVTLPGRARSAGSVHLINRMTDEIIQVFRGIGFDIADGPEIETEYYCFEALNIPADHPARDAQDTFYIKPGVVLRTHTSSVQIRFMEKTKPPVRILSPGAVYRSDYDATHTPMFHQIEGLWVDEKITMADLKGTLKYFAREIFGDKTEIRLRPSFFPFTEPSAEVDVSCMFCKGKTSGAGKCKVCKDTGWLEILGAGMVHPAVFESVGYDSSTISGFAFGMGIERIAMLKYGVNDIRLFYENDSRFLKQF